MKRPAKMHKDTFREMMQVRGALARKQAIKRRGYKHARCTVREVFGEYHHLNLVNVRRHLLRLASIPESGVRSEKSSGTYTFTFEPAKGNG